MSRSRKPMLFHPAAAVLPGLLVAQIIATIQVYVSNAGLYAKVKTIGEAGFLAVPNQHVMPSLLKTASALWGGLFFTLSIGAGLSLFSLAAAWIRQHLFSRSKNLPIVLSFIWMGLLIFVNLHGFCLPASLYILLIPPLVFIIATKMMSPPHRQTSVRAAMLHILPIVVLAGLWFSQYDQSLFIDLRDYILLSNPVGRKINDFYYNYTLYAAEAFKSLNQKLLRTVHLEGSSNKSSARSIESVLIRHDYLPVGASDRADLTVVRKNDTLVFLNNDRQILVISSRDFFSNAGTTLSRFAIACDRHANFRQLVFLSLLLGYPLTLYLLAHAIIWLFFCLLMDGRKAAVISSALCFVLSIGILVQFYFARTTDVTKVGVMQSLQSERWQTRVGALRFIYTNNLEIDDYRDYAKILDSPEIPERYWLAKTLTNSRKPDTYHFLLSLLKDPNPNVVSMAFYALARRGDRRTVKEIIEQIKASHNWYSQLYAYKALRALGWTQSKSH